MEYRVLGPVEVLAGGRPVAIGGPKPRSLPPGYLLTVGEGELDLEVFERWCGEGRAAAARGELEGAAAAYRAGLELWRGPALSGVEAAFAEAEALEVYREGHRLLVEPASRTSTPTAAVRG